MKHQTITLVKFKALSKRLNLPLCWTVGILEGLWLFACHNARDGDLSRFSDLELAGWLEYPGTEVELIDALVETGWLDRNGDNLHIHDWNEHKPNWLKGIQGRSEKEKPSRKPSCVPSPEPSTEPSAVPSTEPPNLTLPNQTKPNETTPYLDPDLEPLSAAWQEVVVECEKLGMDRPELACRYAKQRGCLASEAMMQVEHYRARPGAWGIGLLYKVIEHLRPEKRVQWPEPSSEYTKAKESEQKKKATERAAEIRKQEKEQRAENGKRAAELEAKFGARLDAMSKEEIREILDEHFPMAKALFRYVPCVGSVRKSMLVHLESVAKKATA